MDTDVQTNFVWSGNSLACYSRDGMEYIYALFIDNIDTLPQYFQNLPFPVVHHCLAR